MIQTDVDNLISRIEYARVKAVSEGRQFKLKTETSSGTSTIMVRILSGSNADTPTNESSSCTWNNSNTTPDSYSDTYTFTSTVTTRHAQGSEIGSRNFVAAPNNNNNYSRNTGTLCFNSDGTTTSGGFLLDYEDDKYRVDVFKLGFYSVERYVSNNNCTEPNCWRESD